MNLMGLITVILLGVFSFVGYKRGLMKTVLSLGCILLSLFISNMVYGRVSKFIQDDTHIKGVIQKKIEERIEKRLDTHVNSQTEQIQAIEKLPLPDDMKKLLTDNNNDDVYSELAVTQFSDYVGNLLSCIIVNGIAFLLTFGVLMIFFWVLMSMAKILTDFPLVGWIDSLGGLALGFAKGLLLVWIVYFFVTMCSSTDWGMRAYYEIETDTWMKLINDNNILTKVLYNLTKTLF